MGDSHATERPLQHRRQRGSDSDSNFLLNRSDCSINVTFTNCLVNVESSQICYKYTGTVKTFGLSLWPEARRVSDGRFFWFFLTHQRGRAASRSRAPSTGGKGNDATIVLVSLHHWHHAADPHLKEDHTFVSELEI